MSEKKSESQKYKQCSYCLKMYDDSMDGYTISLDHVKEEVESGAEIMAHDLIKLVGRNFCSVECEAKAIEEQDDSDDVDLSDIDLGGEWN